MSAKAVSYAKVLRRVAKNLPGFCVQTGHSGTIAFGDDPCRRCLRDAAALRALAALVGEAKAASADAGYATRYQNLILRIAAGYTRSLLYKPVTTKGYSDKTSL